MQADNLVDQASQSSVESVNTVLQGTAVDNTGLYNPISFLCKNLIFLKLI